jgi:type I restriction enzyme, S subunit
MSWPQTNFERLYAEPSRNGIYKPKEFHGSGTKIVNMGELFGYEFIGSQEMARLSMTDLELEKSGLIDGDLLFGRRSLIESGAGKCSLVDALDEPTTFESSIIRVRLNPEQCEPRFFYYWFRSPVGRGRVRAIVTGTNVKGIRGSELKDLQVPCPELKVQHGVVDIVRQYDDLIENNRRRIALLEEAARLLYREWFVHFRFPGHEHAKFIDGLPEGWQRRTLGDVSDVVKATVKPESFADDVYIGLEHIPRRSFTLADWAPVDGLASNKLRFEAGDILFGKIRPYFHKVGFALCAGLTSSDAIVWRVRNPEDWPLVVCATSSDRFVSVASKTVREGSKMPRADENVLMKYSIPRPTDGVLQAFNETVRPVTEQCKMLALQNQKLAQARDLLLPRLMSGELAV